MGNWERKLVATTRGEFEVFIKGDGPPGVVTHHYSEFNESGDYFADSFTRSHRVILVNLREAGHSEKATEPYRLSMLDAVLDLEAIREEFGYSTWSYAGHSTGGMIGVLYGIHFSESLTALILVGAAAREYASDSSECIYHPEHPQFENMQDLMEKLKLPTLSADERKNLSKERTKLSLYHPAMHGKYFSKPISKKMCVVRLNFFNREFSIYDVTRQLHKIKTRTLILCGRHDVQCPVGFSIEMDQHIPNSKLHIFESSNHYPFLEEKKLFKRVVEDFVTRK
ncbi:alpha/beta fold hydrolase [Mesobacillus zeae]|uniref:Alpha/beta hydrolase n=1 Tax=Mesobacillus zeae TaxID=1917180 RepID=A0A398BFE2_9BACI|nr:alpha/beta hydrolase [Mesobacillus zeae]RID88314.1 alpha/beta hydrolase [Mesobacillus zeae]